MTLAPGRRLGPYEIISALGAGGMGEVYRARDPRLGREVAIKVLPSEVSSDPDRLRRFEHEARAAAALNHSNIVALHDIGVEEGVSFIVTELLDGRTLRQLLDEERLAVSRVIDLAAQVADGLAAAHSRGMVHRDLKPENVYITTDGRAKILDFGLAKTIDGLSGSVETPTRSATAPYTVLGTAGYMAPEQVRGQPVDHRADIFAFGAVLYEMVTSRRAFAGDTVLDTMSAILREAPAAIMSAPERPLPPSLLRIIDRCLDKSPAGRFQSTTDLAFALKGLSHADSGTMTSTARRADELARQGPSWRRWLPWGVAAGATLVALVAWQPWRGGSSSTSASVPVFQYTIEPPSGTTFGLNQVAPFPAISPNGRQLVFTAAGSNEPVGLWLRDLGTLTARPLPVNVTGAIGGLMAFWSPDGRSIGFFQDGDLQRIDLESGVIQKICPALPSQNQSGAWGPDGTILFFGSHPSDSGGTRRPPIESGALLRVLSTGGDPVAVTTLASGETAHRHPSFLPDGRHFLYQSAPDGTIWVGSLDGGAPKRILSADSRAVYAPPGWLLFVRQDTLLAQPFDADRLVLTGEARYITDNVRTNEDNGRSAFSVSKVGVMVYRKGDWGRQETLTWLDRKGTVLREVKGPPAQFGRLVLIDEKTAVAQIRDDATGTADLWRVDLETGSRIQLTLDRGQDRWPVASPDGSRIAWATDRTGSWTIYKRLATGAGADEPWIPQNAPVALTHWSLNFLVFDVENSASRADVWYATLSGQGPVKPQPYVQTEFAEIEGRLSPDERWMAYQSRRGGTSAVFVQPFPSAGAQKHLVSGRDFAASPRWRSDGLELFYFVSGPDGMTAMAVPVKTAGSTFDFGVAQALFTHHGSVPGAIASTSDGQHFLVALRPADAGPPAPLTVVINWTELVARGPGSGR